MWLQIYDFVVEYFTIYTYSEILFLCGENFTFTFTKKNNLYLKNPGPNTIWNHRDILMSLELHFN